MASTSDLYKLQFNERDINEIIELQKKNKFQINFNVEEEEEEKEIIISTGSESLDSILKGGFCANGINEILGVSGSGKTQLCLQLCLSAQVSQPNKGVLFICTESSFPTARLAQLCELSPMATSKTSDNIFILQCYEFDHLKKILETKYNFLTSRISLIIIDSIAGIFRNTYPDNKYVQRAHDMRYIAHYLHEISMDYKIVVVCTNQVTSSMTYVDKVVPALGISWSNLVTNRFIIDKSMYNEHKKFSIEFSPYLPCAYTSFEITSEGIE